MGNGPKRAGKALRPYSPGLFRHMAEHRRVEQEDVGDLRVSVN